MQAKRASLYPHRTNPLSRGGVWRGRMSWAVLGG
jgi:hypothetical protein